MAPASACTPEASKSHTQLGDVPGALNTLGTVEMKPTHLDQLRMTQKKPSTCCFYRSGRSEQQCWLWMEGNAGMHTETLPVLGGLTLPVREVSQDSTQRCNGTAG